MILSFALFPLVACLPPQGTGKHVGPRTDDDIRLLLGNLALRDRNAYFKAVDDLAAEGARAVPHLVPLLLDTRVAGQVRIGVMMALQQVGEAAAPALPACKKLLDDEKPLYRWFGLAIMQATGDKARPYLDDIRAHWTDEGPRVRGLAFKLTSELTRDRAALLPHLAKALDDTDPEVRVPVLEALIEDYGPAAMPILDKIVEQLVFGNAAVVKGGVLAAAELGSAAVPRLVHLAGGGGGPQYRVPAADALGRVRPATRPQIEAMVRLLRDDYGVADLRKTLLAGLRSIGGPCTHDLGNLLSLAGENKPLVLDVLGELGMIGAAAAGEWKRIAGFLKSDDVDLRRGAARSFLAMGAPAAFPALAAALDDPDIVVRGSAITAIARLGAVARKALPKFIEILGSGQPKLQQRVSTALIVLGAGAAPATDALIRLLGSDDARTRDEAAQSLAAIGAPALPAVIEQVRSGRSPRVRRAAIRVVVALGAKAAAATDVLVDVLAAGDTVLRRDAALALARIGTKAAAATGRLEALLDDPDKDMRIAAVTALGAVGRGRDGVVDAILRVTADGDEAVAWAALEALGWAGNEAAVPKLIDVLGNDDPLWRLRAVRALRAIGKGARSAVPILARMLQKETALFVAQEVATALEAITGRKWQ